MKSALRSSTHSPLPCDDDDDDVENSKSVPQGVAQDPQSKEGLQDSSKVADHEELSIVPQSEVGTLVHAYPSGVP